MTRGIWAVDQAARHLSRLMLARLGVTGFQRLVLRVVGERPGISVVRLGELLRLEPTAVVAHLERLEALGLVTRKPHVDAMRCAIGLTTKGGELDRRAQGTVEAAVFAVVERAQPDMLTALEVFLVDLERELVLQADTIRDTKTAAPKRHRRRRPGARDDA